MNRLNKSEVQKLMTYFNSDQFFNVKNEKDKARLFKEYLDFKKLHETNQLEADAFNLAEKFVTYADKWSKKNPSFMEAYNKIYIKAGESVAVR